MGFRVLPVTRRVDHRNPISGHEWSTYEVVPNLFEVRGPFELPPYRRFRSEGAAQNYADEKAAFVKKFGFTYN